MWWERGVVYEIYPRSFQDTNGDGVGDLRGVADRLPYLARLGVDAIWLTPFFASPMRDFGYDISDHCAIDPSFGTMEDFDALVAAAHGHGIKVVLDFVPNHTSDLHPWFQESRGSRESPKRDWYLWRDGDPPNNWIAVFGGSAWEWDEATGQSYYHAYLPEQPDLNWRNPEVREAMLEVLRFWKGRGVDGFRVDAMRQVLKDRSLRDNPPAAGWEGPDDVYRALVPEFTTDLDEVQEVVAAIRAEIGDEHLFMAEVTAPIERLVRYYGAAGEGAHLPFNFHLIGVEWTPAAIAALVERYEAALPEGAWPNWVLGNHDQPRVASRVGPGQARAAAMLLLTLRGHADALLRRRARPRGRRGPAGAGRGPRRPRPGALADAVDGRARPRLHRRRRAAVAAVRRRRRQRRGAGGRPALDALAAPAAAGAAAVRRRPRGGRLRDARRRPGRARLSARQRHGRRAQPDRRARDRRGLRGGRPHHGARRPRGRGGFGRAGAAARGGSGAANVNCGWVGVARGRPRFESISRAVGAREMESIP